MEFGVRQSGLGSETATKERAVVPLPGGSETTPIRLPYSWRVWLAREQPGRAAAAAALVLAATALVRVVTGQPWLSLLAFVLLALALRDFALPLRFTVREDWAEVRGLGIWQRIEWARVRSVYRDGCGVKLSPLAACSRLEAYRGVYLRLPPREAERVLEAVRMLAKGRTDA